MSNHMWALCPPDMKTNRASYMIPSNTSQSLIHDDFSRQERVAPDQQGYRGSVFAGYVRVVGTLSAMLPVWTEVHES